VWNRTRAASLSAGCSRKWEEAIYLLNSASKVAEVSGSRTGAGEAVGGDAGEVRPGSRDAEVHAEAGGGEVVEGDLDRAVGIADAAG